MNRADDYVPVISDIIQDSERFIDDVSNSVNRRLEFIPEYAIEYGDDALFLADMFDNN